MTSVAKEEWFDRSVLQGLIVKVLESTGGYAPDVEVELSVGAKDLHNCFDSGIALTDPISVSLQKRTTQASTFTREDVFERNSRKRYSKESTSVTWTCIEKTPIATLDFACTHTKHLIRLTIKRESRVLLPSNFNIQTVVCSSKRQLQRNTIACTDEGFQIDLTQHKDKLLPEWELLRKHPDAILFSVDDLIHTFSGRSSSDVGFRLVV